MTIYIAMIDYGRSREAVVNPEHTQRNVVDLIASGEWERVSYVRAMYADGTWSDITEDVARDVMSEVLDRDGEIPDFLRGWLHEKLGVEAVNEAEREVQSVRSDYDEHNTHFYAASGAR